MKIALTVVVGIILVEIAVRLPFSDVIKKTLMTLNKALGVLRAKSVSDQWKEKALLGYARAMFTSACQLAGLLLLLAVTMLALIYVFDQLVPTFKEFVLGWFGIFISIFAASIFFAIRRYVV